MKDEEVTMHYKTFDTHKYIKSLQESGFNEKQAEMLVKSLLESRDFDLSILATREQVSKIGTNLNAKIDKVESSLNAKIDKVESNLEKKITEVKYDILKWIIPIMLTNVAIMVGIALKLL
jgi:phosphopantetheine adenylyltransferase